jgi:glycosyltransferase involved in cell wall biosynthesis
VKISSQISVVIPVLLRNQADIFHLKRALDSIYKQSQLPAEVILSNDSESNFQKVLNEIISDFGLLNIVLLDNQGKRGISSNTNNGLANVGYDHVHVLHQDDWIINSSLYEDIIRLIDEDSGQYFLLPSQLQPAGQLKKVTTWPKFDLTALVGNNLVGGPSGVIFPRSEFFLFDHNLSLYCDLDFVHQLTIRLGKHKSYKKISIEYGVSAEQAQNQISREDIKLELEYFVSKYRTNLWKILCFALFNYGLKDLHTIIKILKHNKHI